MSVLSVSRTEHKYLCSTLFLVVDWQQESHGPNVWNVVLPRCLSRSLISLPRVLAAQLLPTNTN